MAGEEHIAANIARLRLDRQLTQEELARKAGLSRVALGKIERGIVVPRARTLTAIGKALGVPLGDLVTPVRPLETVRFRAPVTSPRSGADLGRGRKVARRLHPSRSRSRPVVSLPIQGCSHSAREPGEGRSGRAQSHRAWAGRAGARHLRVAESNGVKLLLLDKKSDAFFGLSVGAGDGGPAVVVNTWERISVERWIFTAAHELGHLLLHPAEYRRDATELPVQTEREADVFASHFLMPEAAFASEWDETRGHPLLVRVLKVKRIFRVSYKTVLYRLVESGRGTSDIWRAFQRQHLSYFGKTLRRTDEPEALKRSEFAWNWSRSGEPEGLSRHDFVEDRLSRLVRQALEQEHISLGRAAEILGRTREEMRRQAREWVG